MKCASPPKKKRAWSRNNSLVTGAFAAVGHLEISCMFTPLITFIPFTQRVCLLFLLLHWAATKQHLDREARVLQRVSERVRNKKKEENKT